MEKVAPVVATTLSNYSATTHHSIAQGNKKHGQLPMSSESANSEENVDPLIAATKTMNDALQLFKPDTQLEFVIDRESGANLVRLIDNETKEVLRQIPSEIMLRIAKSIQEFQAMLQKQKKMQSSELLHPGTILDDIV